jgi:hypothetical protein
VSALTARRAAERSAASSRARGGNVEMSAGSGDEMAEADVGDEPPVTEQETGLRVGPADGARHSCTRAWVWDRPAQHNAKMSKLVL